MFSIKSLSAAAILVFMCSLSAANAASECPSGKRGQFRVGGHPGKSVVLPQRDTGALPSCKPVARKALVLSSFIDAPGGAALVAGNTDRARIQIASDASNPAELTNLCVLHTVQREWSAAHASCDAAVERATRKRAAVHRWDKAVRRIADRRVAAAYSNRAVLNWLAGDTGASYGDIVRARAIDPHAAFVQRNFELTVRVPVQVQLPVNTTVVG
jgi:hypothetical protein